MQQIQDAVYAFIDNINLLRASQESFFSEMADPHLALPVALSTLVARQPQGYKGLREIPLRMLGS